MSNIEKNKRIKESRKFTREKRKTQKCFVFSTKIDYSKLNKKQREQLKMLFVESKRLYNDILNFMDNGGKLADYDTKKTVVTNFHSTNRWLFKTKTCVDGKNVDMVKQFNTLFSVGLNRN